MWIACKDKMPEDCHRVLLCQPDLSGYEWVLFGHWQAASSAWNIQGTGLRPYDSVTHWQPLPAPPSQEK